MMKKLIFLIFIIIITGTLSSQNFIQDGKQWNVYVQFWLEERTDRYKIEGDTIIESKVYAKLWINPDTRNDWAQSGYLREESGLVYWLRDSYEEGLLYDFNAKAGDTIAVISESCGTPVEMVCKKLETIDFGGVERKVWTFDPESWTGEQWIEGIGSVYGLLFSNHEFCISDINYGLLCYYEDDVLQYQNPNHTACFISNLGIDDPLHSPVISMKPNPVLQNENITINADQKIERIVISDINGRRIQDIEQNSGFEWVISINNFEKGMYFLEVKTTAKPVIIRKLIIQ